AAALGDGARLREWRQDEASGWRFAVLEALTIPVPELPWPPLPADALGQSQTRPWLLPAIFERLERGQGGFLAELRPAASLFVRFGGIDYDTDPAAAGKLDAFIRRVEGSLRPYGGSLVQLTIGDKGAYICAVFGAPVAHEDDVDRAAAAALEIAALPAELDFLSSLHMGLTYGRVLVGAYGSTTRRTYGLQGDTVNLAARLMQAAGAGEILVNDEARGRASDHFVWEPLPAIRVKGKSDPISIFRLLRARRWRAGLTLEGLFPEPPVGRREVQDQMAGLLGRLAAGQGQVVRLSGEAGIGKSHLAAQLSRQAAAQGVRVCLGVCQSVTANAAYTPWRQIFSDLLDLGGLDENAAVRQLAERLGRQGEERALRLPLLGDLLGLPIPDNPATAGLERDVRQKSLFSLVVDLVRAWAAERPLLLIIENEHWLDEASRALAHALAQRATGDAAVMLLLTARPAMLGASLPARLESLPNFTAIHLREMSDEDVIAFIERELGAPPSILLQAVMQQVAHCNPYFVRELLAAMGAAGQIARMESGLWAVAPSLVATLQRANLVTLEDGQWQLRRGVQLAGAQLGVPDSIHELLLSRLDRLPDGVRITLKVSSVIGQIVELALARAAHPEAKEMAEVQADASYLEKEELLQEAERKDVYAFRQLSAQEVAYQTLLYVQRQQLHAAVAQALVEQASEVAAEIAHHAYLGQLWPLALKYNLAAGEEARQLYANQQSIEFFQRALESAERLGPNETTAQRLRIHLALGELLVNAGEYAAGDAQLKAALPLAAAAGDATAEARAYRWLGRSHELRGEYDEAFLWLERGLAALDGRPSAEEAELCLIAGLINFRQGRVGEALARCQRSLAVSRQLDDAAIRARTFNLMGIVEMRRDSAAAVERFRQSLAQYEQLGNVYGQATSHNLIANGLFHLGQLTPADSHYRRALDLFTLLGSNYNQVLVNNNLGGIALKQGYLDAALAYYQRALRQLEQIGGSLWVVGGLRLNMGNVYLRRGQPGPALTELREGQRQLETAGVRDLLPELYAGFAEAAYQQGHLAAAERHGRHALELARELSLPRDEGHSLRILALIGRAQGRPEQSRADLEAAYAVLEPIGDEYESAMTQLCLADLLAAEGELEPAAALLAACAATFERLGARPDLDAALALRQTLAKRQTDH
ncbi:MAG: ATP-binding protein, partial [Candidatus Promineifilaceae bacterium]